MISDLMFQLTAARRRLGVIKSAASATQQFQLTAARRRLENGLLAPVYDGVFQLTAARRRLARPALCCFDRRSVSTHSRPKAAGRPRFNLVSVFMFQLTAARRRLVLNYKKIGRLKKFQLTAARRRLAPPLKPLPNKACIALFR